MFVSARLQEDARSFQLPVANSEIRQFEDQIAIVIERYDRTRAKGRTVRVHQEDICQAMGLPPTRKYQSDDGPGVREIAELLTTYSTAPTQDTKTFVDAIAFNWLSPVPTLIPRTSPCFWAQSQESGSLLCTISQALCNIPACAPSG